MPDPISPPGRISETLLDYAQPFVAALDAQVPPETIRQGFDLAVKIWNASVLDRLRGNSQEQARLERQFGSHWHTHPLIRTLLERRTRHFADDLRYVTECEVTINESGFQLRAATGEPTRPPPP